MDEAMDVLQPWFWDVKKMPAREVEVLTPRQAHRYLDAWAKEASQRSG